MPRNVSRLITELIGLSDRMGWSLADLATELGVDTTTVMHYRSGRRRLTKVMLGRIARRFKEERRIRDLIWNHLITETLEEEGGTPDIVADLPTDVVSALTTYVDRFAQESIHAGRGLYLLSADTSALAQAIVALDRAFERAEVKVCKLRADYMPNAADRRFALAAPLLMVERVEFAKPEIVALLNERANLVRPTIVTSTGPPESTADAYLKRVFLSLTRRIEIPAAVREDTPASPSPTASNHAAS